MKFHSIIFLLAIFLPSFVSAAHDSHRPFDQARDEYFALLLSGDFQRLELEAQASRDKSLTLDDGQPRLAAFYAGVSGCLTSGCTNSLTNEEWSARLARLKEWTSTDKNSTTARIALATFYLEYGWFIRGQGYRESVKENAWPIFQSNIEKSKHELQSLGAQGKSDPGWYASLLRVARSQGWPLQEYNALYAESVKIFPNYLPLYFEKATYLSPRWYGTIKSFRAYVIDVTETGSPASGKTRYARLNWLMSTNDMFRNGQTNWLEMKSGFERIIKDYPHAWNINNFAKFSCLAGDWETFAELDKKINGKPIMAAFSEDAEWYAWCRQHVVSRKEIQIISQPDSDHQ